MFLMQRGLYYCADALGCSCRCGGTSMLGWRATQHSSILPCVLRTDEMVYSSWPALSPKPQRKPCLPVLNPRTPRRPRSGRLRRVEQGRLGQTQSLKISTDCGYTPGYMYRTVQQWLVCIMQAPAVAVSLAGRRPAAPSLSDLAYSKSGLQRKYVVRKRPAAEARGCGT